MTFSGDAAGKIDAAERNQIIALAAPDKTVVRHVDLWLHQIGVGARVYLRPDHGQGTVQRGRMVELMKVNRIPVPATPDWTIISESQRQHYAVVAAGPLPAADAASAAPAPVGAEPFAVVGEISDDALVSLVAVLRLPMNSLRQMTNDGFFLDGSFHLAAVELRSDGTWRAAFLRSGQSGEDFILRREADHWVIVSVSYWVA